ncbi:MAG: T9SS type A sorting domain-containing protein [Flavobacteriaceae bacterium]|nr:T9SS type A sorting domain-containing protein [Flavobacteriaceae bacterium]
MSLILTCSTIFAQNTHTVNLINGDSSGNLVITNLDVAYGDTLRIFNDTGSVANNTDMSTFITIDHEGTPNETINLNLLPGESYDYIFNSDNINNVLIIYNDYTAGLYHNSQINTMFNAMSVSDVNNKPTFSIYPNPVLSHVNITGINQKSLLELYNVSGSKLLTQTATKDVMIDLSKYSSGMCFLKIFTKGNLMQTIKLYKE